MNYLKTIVAGVFISIILFSSCKPRFEQEILLSEVEAHIKFLASDTLEGRYPGEQEDKILAEYITDQMKRAGLILHDGSGIQYFPIVTSIITGSENKLIINQKEYKAGDDFQPMPFTENGEVNSELVFVGYGFQFQNDSISWDDYKNASVDGKIVMILKGSPDPDNTKSPYINYSQDRDKVLLASDMGAAAAILVSGEKFDQADELSSLKSKEHQLGIPAIHIKRSVADIILDAAGLPSVNAMELEANEKGSTGAIQTGQTILVSTDIEPEQVETYNTISILRGADPELRDQYVVIGAHHDHLGWGGAGSSSRQPDTIAIHYGADDNASGVAGVLEISEKLVASSPHRSIMFSTFGAEEMGLMGSRYLVENSPVEPESIQAMINLDMVGRLNEDRQLQISGIGTSPLFERILDSINATYNFSLKYSAEGYGPSDHAAFYAADVPVIFISTGAHTDYHTPSDSHERINYEGAVEVFQFTAAIAEVLANNPEKLAFTEAGPKVRISSRGRYGKVTLGIMPDMNYDGDEGMPVLFVTEGKPASSGGMNKGDIITAIEGKSVGNIYDYMSRLGQLKEGQSIVVTVKRDGDLLELVIRL